MEKSFFNFQAAHPTWKCSPSGQSMVDRLEEYKQTELAAISRERDLYIAAAARQLETLAKWEEFQHSPSSAMNLRRRRFEEERMRPVHHSSRTSYIGSSTVADQDSTIPSSTVNAEIQTAIADDADAGAHPSPKLGPVQPTTPSLPLSLPVLQHNTVAGKATATTTRKPSDFIDRSPTSSINSTNKHGLMKQEPDADASSSQSPSSKSNIQINISASASSPGPSTILNINDDLAAHQNQQGLTTSDVQLGRQSSQEQHQWSASPSSNRGALRAELSTELRRLLTLSTLDTGESLLDAPMTGTSRNFHDPSASARGNLDSSSFIGSPLASSAISYHTSAGASVIGSTTQPDDRRAERQYFWLERFHEHLERQQQQGNIDDSNDMSNSRQPVVSQSMPTPHARGSTMPNASNASSSLSVVAYRRRQNVNDSENNTDGIFPLEGDT